MMTNWAGNVEYRGRVHRPSSVEELRRLVAGSDRIRALGSGHSFNRIADGPGDLVSLDGLPPTIELDGTGVTVTAGIRYSQLADKLHGAGRALPNLGSLPHISVAGACATGTHGSGVGNGSLATAVSALELVTAGGDLVTVDRGTDGFDGMVVALGMIGIVTRITLDTVPAFDVAQYVFEDLPLRRFDQRILAAAYSVSLFTDWSRSRFDQVWLKHRIDAGTARPAPPWPGARPADGPRHPIAGMPPANCTRQLGEPGPWHHRLPHFRAEFTPSSGHELQSEYFVPREHLSAALLALDEVSEPIAELVQVSEVRAIAADDLWLSPCHHRDSAAIHFTWIPDNDAVAAILPIVEQRLEPFDARPHWGKLFGTIGAEAITRYERLSDFRRLVTQYDPDAKFANDFTDRFVGRS